MSRAARAHHAHPHSRMGGAAVSVLLALVAMQLVVATALLSGTRDADIADKSLQGLRAQYAADSAMAMCIREVYVAADEDGDGTIGSVSNDNNSANNPTISAARAVAGAAIAGTDTTITATGSTNDATRKVSATIRTIAAASDGGGSGGNAPGLLVECYELSGGPSSTTSVTWNAANALIGHAIEMNCANTSNNFFWSNSQKNKVALRYYGQITIPTAGSWTFFTNSDDGSVLRINGAKVVDNDGLHSMTSKSGTVTLTAGTHDFEVKFFENSGSNGLVVSWQGPGMSASVPIPPTAFSTPSPPPPAVFSNSIAIWGNNNTSTSASIDAFDSSAGPWSGGSALSSAVVYLDSTGNSAFQMGSGSKIGGNVWLHPNANAGNVAKVWSPSVVTGTISKPGVRYTTVRDAAPTLTSSGAFNNGGTFTVSSDKRYSSFSLWGASSKLVISGDVDIVVDGNFQLTDAAQIEIPAGSRLRLYIGGSFSAWGTSRVNMITALPDNCWIILTGNNSQFNMGDQSSVCAHVRGYDAAVNIYGNSGSTPSFFSGTLRGRTLQITDNAKVHLDIRTGGSGSSGSGAGATTYSITASADVQ